MVVDFSKPLETVDGVRVRIATDYARHQGLIEVYIGDEKTASSYRINGKHWFGNRPDIRNVQPAACPDIQARCVALVEKVANSNGFYSSAMHYAEARAIMAEMRPVDPNMIEAKAIVANAALRNALSPPNGRRDDEDVALRAALAGIERGRAIERGEQ